MRRFPIFLFSLIILGLVSCTTIIPKENPVIQDINCLPCSIPEVDKLITFENYFSSLSPKEKKLECKQLKHNYNVLNDWWSGWFLSYAISEYSACGTIRDGINILIKIRKRKQANQQIQWLIEHQITHLKQSRRINRLKKKIYLSEQQLKSSQEQLSECQNKENTMLLKLNELKNIETSINQRLDENSNESR